MSTHSYFAAAHDEVVGSFGNLSLNDNQRTNLQNNENTNIADSGSSSSVSGDSSTQAIRWGKFRKYIVMRAMSPDGSSELQSLILKGGQFNAMLIFDVISGSLITVMTNQHGYNLFNLILDNCHKDMLEIIIRRISPMLVDIACSEYGTFSIQKLINVVKDKPELALAVISDLSRYSFQLMTCSKGRHVLDLCLTLFPSSYLQVLYEAVLYSWFELAKDPQGCISLNLCIDSIPPPYWTHLLADIIENSAPLSFDSSGTFVVQHVLGLGSQTINNAISDKLRNEFITLSYMQHGSHLVQKCLELSPQGIPYFFGALLQQDGELGKLVIDQFGNYVVQTALKVSKKYNPEIYRGLENSLRQLERKIGKTIHGVHVFRVLNGLSRS